MRDDGTVVKVEETCEMKDHGARNFGKSVGRDGWWRGFKWAAAFGIDTFAPSAKKKNDPQRDVKCLPLSRKGPSGNFWEWPVHNSNPHMWRQVKCGCCN